MKDLDRALTGIVIDPGNGGADIGSTGNGITEKDMNLNISKYMYDRFKELGVPVSITRTEDIDLEASTRTKKALDTFGDSKDVIVISNHINSGGEEGAEVIYALRNTDALSQKIINNLAQEGQKINKGYQRRLPTDPSKDYYAIIRDTPNTEALIVEYGYADNASDAARLKNDYEDYAEAVVRAIIEYKGLTYTPPKGSTNYYTVKSGDTLWTIARANSLTVDKLKEINNLTSNSLSIGQILKLPDKTTEKDTSDNIYTVVAGDSLWKIAQKYNTSVSEIKKTNNLSSNNLSIGQQLIIPFSPETSKPQSTGLTYIVKSGDSLWTIANRFGTTIDKIKSANNLKSDLLSIGQILTIPTSNAYTNYTVVKGDTLYLIAQKFKTSVDKIKRLNNLSTNNLSIGQKLLIPN